MSRATIHLKNQVTKSKMGRKEMTKLDQMIEELNKKNPGKDTKKKYGGTY